MNSILPSGMEWRLLRAEDGPTIRDLTADCLKVDGGLPFVASDPVFAELYAPLLQGTAIGGFDKAGYLMACAGVKLDSDPDEVSAITVGMVHPDSRRLGIGSALLAWSTTEARTLFTFTPGDSAKRTLYLQSEFITEDAARLYANNGFVLDHAAHVMRRDLAAPLPAPNLPAGITLAGWSDENAADFFQVYEAAFRERPGYPGWSAEFWIARARDDEDFLPERSLIAYAGEQPVGFITTFKDFIGQVGVHPVCRKRGLGRALVVLVLERAGQAGDKALWLDVNVNNPEATRVYSQLDFDFVGSRGSYALTLT